ncbi:MAG: PQQ-dependent sugar dehydrogenase [Solirubrobacterales bacterium]
MASSAVAAGPPPPKAVSGNKVAVVGSGAGVPAQFAWAKGDMFIASAAEGQAKGGIYVIKKGTKKAKLVPGTPKAVFGIAFYKGKFYISEGSKISVYARWNGKRFKSKKVVFKANRKNFTSFNGVAISPKGRIYTGVTFQFDNKASTKKYASSVVSFGRTGGDLKVIATGIRQPWQLTFLDGEKQPVGTALGSDTPDGTDAADFIYKANPGSKFGFPTCEWGPSYGTACDSFTKPLRVFEKKTPATSPTGITHRGQKLFVALFGAMKVVSMNKEGKSEKDVLTGFPAPAVGVGVYKGHLYSSDVTGSIYKVKL